MKTGTKHQIHLMHYPPPPHTHPLYIWHFPTLKIHHFAPNLYSAMKFIVPLKVRGHGQFYPQDDPCD